ncbi:Rdx family protein [Sphingomonas sp. QA11]|uniref:Rdx family protein n=1 Tax=Sphingomonas sp. QA11 TaxID=2950605 RepID=UPI00234A2FB0|nr:Rdx family protein [Sphingomonas sp. QA11]WCM27401.1 Rdx family protein [Sphingomonas sp. QA11]
MTKVDITFCRPCGYEKRARSVAQALKQSLGLDAEIHAGGGGIFEVRVDNAIVAKRTREHFPDAAEIVGVVSERLAVNQA